MDRSLSEPAKCPKPAVSNVGLMTMARGFPRSDWKRCSKNWKAIPIRKAEWGLDWLSSSNSSKRTAAKLRLRVKSVKARNSDLPFLTKREGAAKANNATSLAFRRIVYENYHAQSYPGSRQQS